MTLDFIATTITGFEDIAAREVERLLGTKAEALCGKVFFRTTIEGAVKLNLWSRTLHKVVLLLCRGNAEKLEDVYKLTASIDFTKFIEREQSFAIRAERIGGHPFTSLDIAAEAGQAVIDSFKSKTGHRLRVDLDNPDVEVFCQLRNSDFYIGINLTGESLHKRNYRVFDHPAALKTTIASAMIYWSDWTCDKPLLDPMCGGGTIPIEAALMARNVAPGLFRKKFALEKLVFIGERCFRDAIEEARRQSNRGLYNIYGIDVSPKFIEGAKKNASSAGVNDTIRFTCLDATKIDKVEGLETRYVVVNLPYGIRSLRNKVVEKLYTSFLSALRKRGCEVLVAITASEQEFRRAMQVNEFKLLDMRHVYHGSLLAGVFKCSP